MMKTSILSLFILVCCGSSLVLGDCPLRCSRGSGCTSCTCQAGWAGVECDRCIADSACAHMCNTQPLQEDESYGSCKLVDTLAELQVLGIQSVTEISLHYDLQAATLKGTAWKNTSTGPSEFISCSTANCGRVGAGDNSIRCTNIDCRCPDCSADVQMFIATMVNANDQNAMSLHCNAGLCTLTYEQMSVTLHAQCSFGICIQEGANHPMVGGGSTASFTDEESGSQNKQLVGVAVTLFVLSALCCAMSAYFWHLRKQKLKAASNFHRLEEQDAKRLKHDAVAPQSEGGVSLE